MLLPRSTAPGTTVLRTVAGAVLALVVVLVAVPATAAADEVVSDPAAFPRQQGTVSVGAPEPCLDGYDCTGFTVSDCPELVGSLSGTYAVARPDGEPRGVAVFLSGGGGQEWFGTSSRGVNPGGATIAGLALQGFVVVQLRWSEPGWLTAVAGDALGPDVLACRPATAIRHLHDSLYAPLGLAEAPGRCGFCVVGVSGGASAIAYALTTYGIDDVIDAAVLASGPPHAAIDKGCLAVDGYSYTAANRNTIDRSYGIVEGDRTGPCRVADGAMAADWAADSVGAPGPDHLLPTTRVELVFGGRDDPAIWAHSRDFAAVLTAAGSPKVEETMVTEAGHAVYNDESAMAVIEAELAGDVPPPPDPAPSVVVASPTAGEYRVGEAVVADYACAPGDSGDPVASCTGPVAPGEPVDTSVAGTHGFTVEAADAAGRVTTETVTYRVVVPGPRVLLVVGHTAVRGVDARLLDHLVAELDATVTVRDDGAAGDVTGYDVIVLSDTVDPSAVRDGYGRAPTGLVALDGGTWEDLGIASQDASTSAVTALAVADAGHALAPTAPTRRSLMVTSDTATLAWVEAGRLGRDAVQVLSLAKVPSRVVDVGYETGATLASGDGAPARRVGLGFTGTAVNRLNQAGWAVLDSAVRWAAEG